MNARPVKSILVLALLAMAGCATYPERDAALENARVAVYAARSNPQVVTYAPGELDQALATLRSADDVIARGGSISEVHRLADLAQQRAASAQETARLRVAEAALTAQRTARDAQVQADLSRQQAQAAQIQAAEAARRAEDAQRQAAAVAAPLAPPVVVQPSFGDLGAQMTARGVVVTLTDLMYEPGRPQLTSGAMSNVQRLAAYLIAHPDRGVLIEGFGDNTGNRYVDRRLAQDRANALKSALVSLGVDPSRVTVQSY